MAFGVSLTAGQWLEMTGLVLVGLIPFIILGILVGHLLSPDSLGPVLGGGTALLALLSGAFGTIVSGGLLQVVKALPSYWLVQAGKSAVGGGGWPPEAWVVVAAWSVALTLLTARVYQRDTGRI